MKSKGFTLIELLVVIAIIGVLSTMIVSSLSDARQKARIVQTAAQLKAIERGLFAATIEENRGRYWTIVELGGGGTGQTRTLAQMLAIEYPNPGWAISNYLNLGHTKYFNGSNVLYRNTGNSTTACTTSENGVKLIVTNNMFSPAEEIELNKIIDGEESVSNPSQPGGIYCGKFSPHPTNRSPYHLSRHHLQIQF